MKTILIIKIPIALSKATIMTIIPPNRPAVVYKRTLFMAFTQFSAINII